jgi:hypothetical protein
MRVLLIDIETAPAMAYVWSLRDRYIPIERLITPGHTLCFAAKWLGEREVIFRSVQSGDRKAVIKAAHKLLDEADAVCHYNGRKFDIPVLEAEFLTHGMRPPSPFHQIDLYATAKRFALPSRKLDYISRHLDLGRKTKHKGMELWTACMSGEESAWRVMERYNRQDIRLLERLYNVLRPWIKDHPNHSIADGECCPTCGSHNLRWKGWRESITRRYRRFVCNDCGAWGRAVKSEPGTAITRSLA